MCVELLMSIFLKKRSADSLFLMFLHPVLLWSMNGEEGMQVYCGVGKAPRGRVGWGSLPLPGGQGKSNQGRQPRYG